MADKHNTANVPARRQRVVRRLDAPAPAAPGSLAAPDSAQHDWFDRLHPRSVFWRAQKENWQTSDASLAQLNELNDGLGTLSGQVSGIRFPTTLGVTTAMSAADAQVVERLAVAVETLAQQGGDDTDCSNLETLTPRSFSLVARLAVLATHLMDRKEVSASSTVKTFSRDAKLIDEVRKLLDLYQAEDVHEAFESVFDPDPFETWAQKAETDRAPEVYEELQQRAAMLLAIQCLVATQALDGEAPDWPPHDAGTTPPAAQRAA